MARLQSLRGYAVVDDAISSSSLSSFAPSLPPSLPSSSYSSSNSSDGGGATCAGMLYAVRGSASGRTGFCSGLFDTLLLLLAFGAVDADADEGLSWRDDEVVEMRCLDEDEAEMEAVGDGCAAAGWRGWEFVGGREGGMVSCVFLGGESDEDSTGGWDGEWLMESGEFVVVRPGRSRSVAACGNQICRSVHKAKSACHLSSNMRTHPRTAARFGRSQVVESRSIVISTRKWKIDDTKSTFCLFTHPLKS